MRRSLDDRMTTRDDTMAILRYSAHCTRSCTSLVNCGSRAAASTASPAGWFPIGLRGLVVQSRNSKLAADTCLDWKAMCLGSPNGKFYNLEHLPHTEDEHEIRRKGRHGSATIPEVSNDFARIQVPVLYILAVHGCRMILQRLRRHGLLYFSSSTIPAHRYSACCLLFAFSVF